MYIDIDPKNKNYLIVYTARNSENGLIRYNCAQPLYDVVRERWHVQLKDLGVLTNLLSDDLYFGAALMEYLDCPE